MSPLSDRPPTPGRRSVAAIALICLGLLILVPSGLCTGAMGLFDIFGNGRGEILAIALRYSGLPLLIGFVLLMAGLNMPRRE
jgi:TRAP-type C4-dicarboxylate transport system permease small subunit